MGLENRDYIRGEHPPTCSCVECVNIKLGLRDYHKEQNSGKSSGSVGLKIFAGCLVLAVIGVLGFLFYLLIEGIK